MSFLPPNTKKPETSSGNYMKFIDGENRIRIVTDAIVGWEWWVPGENGKNKPVRVQECPEEVPAEAVSDGYGNYIKEFYAFGVYNYAEKKIQILEITQKSIQEKLFNLEADPDWGDPKGYDIKIIRGKKGERVVYDVATVPHKELSMEVANAAAEKPMNLNALWEGKDPFEYVNANEIAKTLG
jgi:hypothetical protein